MQDTRVNTYRIFAPQNFVLESKLYHALPEFVCTPMPGALNVSATPPVLLLRTFDAVALSGEIFCGPKPISYGDNKHNINQY